MSRAAPAAVPLARPLPTRLARRQLFAALIGNVFEFYDFMVYAFLASVLARKFFHGGEIGSLLATFAAFGVGFLARPLGGALIGRFADRHGRRRAMMLTVVGMALGTVGIGVLPTYDAIGLLAPVLLVVLRLLQGLAAGGEWGTSAAFIVESAPTGKRGFYGSFGQSAVAFAIMASNIVVLAINGLFSSAQMDAWGWRVPFLLGALLVPVGIYMRRHLEETPAYEKARLQEAAAADGAGALDGRTPERIGRADTHDTSDAPGTPLGMMSRAFGFTIIWTVSYYMMLAYMPTFVGKYAGLGPTDALLSNTVALGVLVLATPLSGWLSDRVGRKPLLLGSCIGFALLAYPLFRLLLAHGTLPLILSAQIALNLLIAAFSGAGPAALCEMFPTTSRTMLMSIGYSLSTALFGGFAPFIATWLIGATGSPLSPTMYLIAAAVVSGIVIATLPETAHRRLR